MGERASGVVPLLDRLSLIGIGCGILLMVQPFWAAGLQVGFWWTIVTTLVQIVASHLLPTVARGRPVEPEEEA